LIKYICRSLCEILTEKREPKKPKVNEIHVNDWRNPDLQKEAFLLPEAPPEVRIFSFKFRTTTALQIFLKFLSDKLLKDICKSSSLIYDGGKCLNNGLFDPKFLYRFVAIKIHVQGLNNSPKKPELTANLLKNLL
jgi:hypothetical protein